MPLIPELVAFQIPPFLLCGLGIQRKTLEFEVFVALFNAAKEENTFHHFIKGHPISQAVLHFRAKRSNRR